MHVLYFFIIMGLETILHFFRDEICQHRREDIVIPTFILKLNFRLNYVSTVFPFISNHVFLRVKSIDSGWQISLTSMLNTVWIISDKLQNRGNGVRIRSTNDRVHRVRFLTNCWTEVLRIAYTAIINEHKKLRNATYTNSPDSSQAAFDVPNLSGL